ncbi:MAG TPA: CHAT domain-containing protein, partial [Acetobacteraceae bacterium]|nr:CHAT domain-containing protein [Acetobacteraceae bacterium]
MRRVTFRLDGDRLTNSAAPHPRRVTEADFALFAAWTKDYRAAVQRGDNHDGPKAIGQKIHEWLDREHRWMAALRQTPGAPVVAEFAVKAPPDGPGRVFLEVPWELAAGPDDFLAADPAVMWAPLRRIGTPQPPEQPGHDHRLGVMFMAAAPRGQTALNFEAEEAAILDATRHAGLDLFVEDTGTLEELRAAWARARTLDALHLSCHGGGGANPVLALEDETGEQKLATLPDLAGGFAHRPPRLLFLSACHTGEGAPELDSLALGLVNAGFAAVLGWADAVLDRDASEFAASFYGEAAQPGALVEAAWATARFNLVGRRPEGRRPAHWHLARLFLGPAGGGSLNEGDKRRVAADSDAGRKAMIRARGAAGNQIEVASHGGFVGRRKQIQDILREFRRPLHAGVLVHGFGRQGKSSLAARIMDRLPHLKPVVLFQRCDGPNLLAEIAEQVPPAGTLCAEYQPQVDPARAGYDPQALYRALRALLTRPCSGKGDDRPILLVLDDFEALLDPPEGDGHWQVKPAAEAPLAAIIRAFGAGETECRLLITCRYAFPFRDR